VLAAVIEKAAAQVEMRDRTGVATLKTVELEPGPVGLR
jgi:hypothetical protein